MSQPVVINARRVNGSYIGECTVDDLSKDEVVALQFHGWAITGAPFTFEVEGDKDALELVSIRFGLNESGIAGGPFRCLHGLRVHGHHGMPIEVRAKLAAGPLKAPIILRLKEG